MASEEKNFESTGSVSCGQEFGEPSSRAVRPSAQAEGLSSVEHHCRDTRAAPPTQGTLSAWLRVWRWLRLPGINSASPVTDRNVKHAAGKTGLRSSQWENLQTILIAVFLAILIRAYVAESRYIPSASMVPTLQIGDRVVVEKLSAHFHPPRPGDIVVFRPPEALQIVGYTADQAFIKRVIGQPGQVVRVDHGKVYVDDQPIPEPYIAEPPNYEWGPWQVPDHTFFVMGDNRNNSNDSHIWGFLPENHIIGRAWFRFWPPRRVGPV